MKRARAGRTGPGQAAAGWAPARALVRRGRLTRAGLAALAAVVLALGVAGTAAAISSRPARLPRAGQVRLPVAYNGMDGWSGGRVRPAVLYVGGPDTFVRTARWARWTQASAVSHAVLWVDDCRPDCAAGHYRRYPATVTLSRAADRAGASFFSRMSLRYYHGRQRDYAFRWGTYRGATAPLWIGGPG